MKEYIDRRYQYLVLTNRDSFLKTHTHTHTRTNNARTLTHIHIHTRTHARTIPPQTRTTHAHTHARMHAHIHTHACTHARTHTHTQHKRVPTKTVINMRIIHVVTQENRNRKEVEKGKSKLQMYLI